MARKKRDFSKECSEISEFVNFIKPQADKEKLLTDTCKVLEAPKDIYQNNIDSNDFKNNIDINEFQNNVDINEFQNNVEPKYLTEKLKECIANQEKLNTIKDITTIPTAIIENINKEYNAKFATDGSLGLDLTTREEVIIPCNNYFKQAENIIGFLFDKVKDIYTGNMKAEKDFDIIANQIKTLNNQYNKYQYTLIPMNVKIKYPEGYGALLIPRSSTFKKYGLLQCNSVGLIDSDFCLEHGFPVINLTNKDIIIPAGTPIAQLVFIKKENIKLLNGIVDYIPGHDGHGSTDK
jgi:dUTP pyrophosphatase